MLMNSWTVEHVVYDDDDDDVDVVAKQDDYDDDGDKDGGYDVMRW